MKNLLTYLCLAISILSLAQEGEKNWDLRMETFEEALHNYELDPCFFVTDKREHEAFKTKKGKYDEDKRIQFDLDLRFQEDMVFDYSDVLNPGQEEKLNSELTNFALETSNQFFYVFVDDLCGLTPNQYATEYGEFWTLGQKDEDNGLILLFKDKTEKEKGEIYIAIGKGLEGPIPDLMANRIIQEVMIPRLKEGKKMEAINEATEILMALASGEYNEKVERLKRRDDGRSALLPVTIFILLLLGMIFIVWFLQYVRIKNYAELNNISYEEAKKLLLAQWAADAVESGSRHGRGYHWGGGGGFSSRGGGGSSGGFGGVGGGSFGGGGAGGSW